MVNQAIPPAILTIMGLILLRAGHVHINKPNSVLALSMLPPLVVLNQTEPIGKDNITCSGSWGKTGFICDKKMLIMFGEDDMKNITQFKLASIEMLSLPLKIMKSSLSKHVIELSRRDMRIYHTRIEHNTPVSSQQVSNNSDICWNHMATIRNNSLCSICSANNTANYFENKAIINIKTCQSMLSICHPHFMDLMNIAEFLRSDFFLKVRLGSQRSISAYKLLDLKYNIPVGLSYAFDSKYLISPGEINIGSDVINQKNACVHLMSIREIPALHKITLSMLKELKINLDLINSESVHNWHDRHLQSIAPHNLFRDITTDITFISKITSDITVIDITNRSPMNLELSFP